MSKANPIALSSMSRWQAERIDATVERVRLALASDHLDRAFRVLVDFERTSQESPPVESLLDDRAAARLRVRGVLNLADLKAAKDDIKDWPEISNVIRKRINAVLAMIA